LDSLEFTRVIRVVKMNFATHLATEGGYPCR
jgi:hypothetical protein